jgi:hypothetical protein
LAPASDAAATRRRTISDALMFACPRDNGANALQWRFPGRHQTQRIDANHAFTEGTTYIVWMLNERKGVFVVWCQIVTARGLFSSKRCNDMAASPFSSGLPCR